MSRITGNNIKLGSSYVIGQSQNEDEIGFNYDDQNFLSTLTPELRRKIEGVVKSAQDEAAKIKAQAEVQAQNLISQTQEKAYQEGFESGLKEGKEKGMADIKQELNNKINTFEKFINTTANIKQQIIKSCESEILQLSVIIAEKIIKKKLNENNEFLTTLVSASISQLKNKESIKISVHPEFSNKMFSISNELKNRVNGIDSIKIIEDTTIPPEGIIVESTDTRIDASFMAQLDIIIRNLLSSIDPNDSVVADEFNKKENNNRK